MKSFGILRTNVGLTTNVKITIDSNYNLSLDSIESNQNLSLDRFKKVKFNKKNFYDELIPFFFKEIPSETAFEIKFDNDIETIGDDFRDQYDEIYQYGARNIQNNKNYNEEYEYFAPLYVQKGGLPKHFIIFRVDGPGVSLLTKENFIVDILRNFKVVKLFDLTSSTPIGEWLKNNITDNQFFPETPLEMDFRELEFCKWNGIDYTSGGYTSKSIFIDDILDEEKEIYGLEKFIFDQYKANKCVFANILNLNFLFDDSPATPDIKRKWSINRYFGFYLDDLELVTSASPYITPLLKDDCEILNGNIITSPTSETPFVLGWSDDRPFYVEYLGNYYKVEKFTETIPNQLVGVQGNFANFNTQTPGLVNEQFEDVIINKFRIISDIDLAGKQNEINKNYIRIDEENSLINYDNSPFEIENFENWSVWIIEIDGIFHNLIYSDGVIKVNTDYSFSFNENDYSYKVAGEQKRVTFIPDNLNQPKKFGIWRAKFTDLKDFDTRIIDTEYSKYEYEKETELTNTDEPKMYVENLSTLTQPRGLDDFRLLLNSNSDNEVVNIPASSEYTVNYETFKIERNNLSDIWRKNPVYCRWSFQGSLSSNDYPYALNNSLVFEDFNRTVNTFDPDPKRVERNLDYFYTLNSSTSSYIHHSLHIEKFDSNGNLDNGFIFELDKYLNLATYSVGTNSFATYSSDYFTDFFYQTQLFANGSIKRNVKKYAEFNPGDISTPNVSLFRGLRFKIFDIESVQTDITGQIQNINLKTSNAFDEYKISVLLTDNDKSVDFDGNLVDSSNSFEWEIVSDWKMDYDYASGSIVLFNDILYKSNTTINTSEPVKSILSKQVKTAPYNLVEWNDYTPTGSPFWQPTTSYLDSDYVYNNEEWYYYDSTGSEDFWNPNFATNIGYSLGDVVIFKGKYYQSTKNDNAYQPDYKTFHFSGIAQGFSQKRWWVATQSTSPKWKTIDLWNPIISYTVNKLIVHKNTIWKSTIDVQPSEEPGVSTYWQRIYSLEPDTDFYYNSSNNPVIQMNNSFYLCTNPISSSSSNPTLDNGIVIYVNKKWKNILVNINISDNTYKNLSGVVNLINAINDISNKYDFTDYVSYVIINEDGKITKHNYSNNLKTLSCKLEVDTPDEFSIKVNSLTINAITKPDKLNAVNFLQDGNIRNISELNYYNNIPIAAEIIENKFEPKVFENYSNNKNIVKNQIYRHSGNYMPTFYDIQLFYKGLDDNSDNTKFDTSLTDFGIMKERKIRKINRNGSVLKLRNEQDIKSIYPMLDEFGYTWRDFFIFSSTWDLQYHWETEFKNKKPAVVIEEPTITSQVSFNFGQPLQYVNFNKNKNQNL